MIPTYESAVNELCRRILFLIPAHPEIMDMEEPWPLFKVTGFECGDLQPTLAMAQAALGHAQYLYREAGSGIPAAEERPHA